MSSVIEKSEQQKKMKVLIFGATGSIGRELVEQALAKGYAVTVFMRNPAKVDLEHADVTVAQGDIMDPLSTKLFAKHSPTPIPYCLHRRSITCQTHSSFIIH
jgi:nucleoside-diphosphate-sugar epimerase